MTARHFLSRLFDEPRAWLEFVVVRWPESPSGGVLRRAYWRWRLGCPRDCGFGRGVVVDSPALTRVGRNTSFSSETIISASDSAGIYIGDNVITGPRCLLRAGNHRIDRLDIPIRDQGHVYQELDYNGRTYSIVIEDDVWLGANVIVLSGAWIGGGTAVAAGSVVKGRIPPRSVIGRNGIHPRRPRSSAVTPS